MNFGQPLVQVRNGITLGQPRLYAHIYGQLHTQGVYRRTNSVYQNAPVYRNEVRDVYLRVGSEGRDERER